jgi:hypothetical protein
MGDSKDVSQRDVPCSSLYFPKIISVDAGALCQLLLAEPCFEAQLSDSFPECHQRILHAGDFQRVPTISLHAMSVHTIGVFSVDSL